MKKIILASASPRRRKLLDKIGIKFEVYPTTLNETSFTAETPEDTVLKLALEKASQAAEMFPDCIVIGADTIVVYDNHILGKPINSDDAMRMLQLLSGKIHRVLTGIAIIDKSRNIKLNDYEKTFVTMRILQQKEIEDYVSSGEPMDKAGAYAIQGEAKKFIIKIEGCYNNVVGLPLLKLAEMLKKVKSEE
ncbi:septum formation inhibitor Maf [Candidatus Poribacteria bacterium]|nr:septum formation inhibitor Maf [Candidatus Poribacteria bacterium]